MKGDEFDLAAIRKAINPDTRIVFLANPNNPTGTIIDASSLDRFLGDVPEHVVVVLDEAYYEFALRLAEMQKMQYPQSLAYVRRSSRVVVLRTFSKVHGLAGLRIGCGLGPAELLGYCGRMANTYSISSIAQLAALAALEDREHIERTVTNNAEQAEVLHKALAELGFRVVPTCANFIYCDLGQDAARFALRLQAEGLSVRPLGAWGSARCIRVSIATPEQNQSFLEGAAKIRDSRE
jgi:histidinol-phosphate aminotransferase